MHAGLPAYLKPWMGAMHQPAKPDIQFVSALLGGHTSVQPSSGSFSASMYACAGVGKVCLCSMFCSCAFAQCSASVPLLNVLQ
eukprot:1155889-Pelagomonas_calceolata.AAC.3